MTVAELLRWGSQRLGPPREGLPQPAREARWLLASALGVEEAWLWAHREESVPPDTERLFRASVERRRGGEPAHYLLGSCPFWGRDFFVTPAVLIPRPETELLVAASLALPLPPAPAVLDVGTGSGCLAVTLAAERPDARVLATDVSVAALCIARANARRHGVAVRFLAADLTAPIRGTFDLVVANLPYVPDGTLPGLAPEVRCFEPRLALAGGEDGTRLLRRLLADLTRLLAKAGHALLEIGPGQAELLDANLPLFGLYRCGLLADTAGAPRVLHLALATSPREDGAK